MSKHPNEDDAWVDEMEGGYLKNRDDATRGVVRNIKPRRPEEYLPADTFRRDGREEGPLKVLPRGKLSKGIKPSHQLIYSTVQRQAGATFEDIVRSLVSGYRVIPHTEFYLEETERMVEEMGSRALLGFWDGEYHIAKELEYGELVEFKEGWDPRMKKAEERARFTVEGGASYNEIRGYLMDWLGWVEKAENVESVVSELAVRGVLSEGPEGWYKFEKPLEPYGGS